MTQMKYYGIVEMKAIVCTKYGSQDVLQLKDIEKPTPNNNEVLIKVYAAVSYTHLTLPTNREV